MATRKLGVFVSSSVEKRGCLFFRPRFLGGTSFSYSTMSSRRVFSSSAVRGNNEDEEINGLRAKEVLVLGIETSCDDAAAAVVDGTGNILGQRIATAHESVTKWSGVVPIEVSKEHAAKIDGIVETSLRSALGEVNPTTMKKISAIAVTVGPGLAPALRIGVTKAHELSYKWGIPIISVNHLEGHALTIRMKKLKQRDEALKRLEFPFAVLLISGGHSQILVAQDVGKYVILGKTLDDAIGEAYDKVYRMIIKDVPQLDLARTQNVCFGRALELLAKEGDPNAFQFSIATNSKTYYCDMSFSGPKSQIMRELKRVDTRSEKVVKDIAASFQHASISQLLRKIKTMMTICRSQYPDVKTLAVSGGVASNRAIREALIEFCDKEPHMKHHRRDQPEPTKFDVVFPEMSLCTDNAAMIAWVGIEKLRKMSPSKMSEFLKSQPVLTDKEIEEKLPKVMYFPRLAIDPHYARGQRTALDDIVNKKEL